MACMSLAEVTVNFKAYFLKANGWNGTLFELQILVEVTLHHPYRRLGQHGFHGADIIVYIDDTLLINSWRSI